MYSKQIKHEITQEVTLVGGGKFKIFPNVVTGAFTSPAKDVLYTAMRGGGEPLIKAYEGNDRFSKQTLINPMMVISANLVKVDVPKKITSLYSEIVYDDSGNLTDESFLVADEIKSYFS